MLRRLLVLLSLVLPLCVISSTPAHASASESEFVSRTNSARASRGMRGYAVRSDLVSVARRQAARMAAARRIYHNPNLGSEVRNWRDVGENVGTGGTVARIHTAFMNSPSHRANILSGTFTEVGIGTARGGDGRIYVAEVFRRPTGSTYYASSAPAPTARRTTTTTTVRRTRTTTTRPTVTRRASRGAIRRPLPPARPVAVRVVPRVNPMPRRIASAWLLYRRERPVSSLDHALTFVRTTQLLAG